MRTGALKIAISVLAGAALISVPVLTWTLSRSTDERDEWRHRYESVESQWLATVDARNALHGRVDELERLNGELERVDEQIVLYVEIADWLVEQLRFVYGAEPKLTSQPMDTHPIGVVYRKADRIGDGYLLELVGNSRFVP